MTLSKQWLFVGAIVTGLMVVATCLVLFGPTEPVVSVGRPAPDFRAVDVRSGDSVRLLERYRGHVTLVNIWRTDCAPCRTEMPAMERLYTALAPRGFRVAAVSMDLGASDDVREFASEFGLTFDVLQDRTALVQDQYETTGVPESFLLDSHGVIMKRVIGAYEWDSPFARALIGRLLDDSAPGADSTARAGRSAA